MFAVRVVASYLQTYIVEAVKPNEYSLKELTRKKNNSIVPKSRLSPGKNKRKVEVSGPDCHDFGSSVI